jgi:signal transduction histidine kinase
MPASLRSAWRYLLAAAIGLVAWAAATAERLAVPLTGAQEDIAGAMLLLDLLVGAVALALLPWRRRHPLAVACLTTAAFALSVSSVGPAIVAVVSMATHRRRAWVVAVAAVHLAAGMVAGVLLPPLLWPTETGGWSATGGLLLGATLFAATVATGFYVGARRDLLVSLRQRAETAERERELTTVAARAAERTRIAREMHDVLAHRISLVALHAGALAYRDDLTRAQTAETAGTIQANAQLALSELRQVLGVLRSGPPAAADDDAAAAVVAAAAEPPQPTLAELPALLADAREAGSPVRLDTTDLAGLPPTLSRTSFRIIQEALTNARKHAAGKPVTVHLTGTAGADLRIEVRNPSGTRADGERAGPGPSGLGLAGLTERAELAGGTLIHGPQPDGSFLLRARLPWPA